MFVVVDVTVDDVAVVAPVGVVVVVAFAVGGISLVNVCVLWVVLDVLFCVLGLPSLVLHSLKQVFAHIAHI